MADARIKLEWDHAGVAAADFAIYRDDSPMDPDALPVPIAVVDGADRDYMDDDSIVEDDTYYYRVAARVGNIKKISDELKIRASPDEPLWEDVVFLSNFNGVDDGTTFIDERGHVVSANQNTKTKTDVYKYGGAAAYFNGSAVLEFSDSDDWDFGDEDFTVETWVCFSSTGSTVTLIGNYLSSTKGWSFQRRADNNSLVFGNGDVQLIARPWSPSADTWYHVAVCRSGTDLRLFVDGSQLGATATNSTDISGSTRGLAFGSLYSNGWIQRLHGYLDDARITKAARHTTVFSPPGELDRYTP